MLMQGWVFSIQQRINQARRQVQPRLLWQYAAVFLIVILMTLILLATKSHLGETKVSLVYLLLVLCCAMVAHPGVTFFCGLWSFLCYDFFLVPPYFDLRFASPIQVLDPLAFVVAAVVTSAIAERARQHASEKAAYQKADQLRATLLNLVSHNLRTPLATVKTALTTLLTQDKLTSENRQLLDYADAEVDHLNRLVANVLHLSRLEASAVQINKRWDALDELVMAVFGHWPQETAAGLLSADLAATLPFVQFDFDLLEAVLTNLVDNALRHGASPVRVSLRTHPGEVWISVEDSGRGIALPDRAKLFGKFSKVKSKGIGLGLAVCKGLVEAHGGRIWAEFLADQTRFTFTLPYAATVISED